MYVATPDMHSLRQGDIIADIHMPKYGITDLEVIHRPYAPPTKDSTEKVILPSNKRHVAVISQCCEFNEGKRNSFSIAELTGISEWIRPSRKFFGINLAEILSYTKIYKKFSEEELLATKQIS